MQSKALRSISAEHLNNGHPRLGLAATLTDLTANDLFLAALESTSASAANQQLQETNKTCIIWIFVYKQVKIDHSIV